MINRHRIIITFLINFPEIKHLVYRIEMKHDTTLAKCIYIYIQIVCVVGKQGVTYMYFICFQTFYIICTVLRYHK